MADITELAHERDDNGELLPVTETVTVNDTEYDVEVYPATSGQQNEWRRRLSDANDGELGDEITFDLIEEFAAYDPSDFGAGSWGGVRPAITEALSSAALAKVFDADDPDQFVAELEDAAQAAEGN